VSAPLEDELMRVFNFTPEELALNQQGQMSNRQAESRRRKQYLENVSSGGILIIVLLFVLPALLGAPNLASDNGPFLVFAVVLGVGGILSLSIVTQRNQQLTRDLNERDVKSAEGHGQLYRTGGRSKRSFHFALEGIDFRVSWDAYWLLSQYEQAQFVYRVFYTPHAQRILSVQIVG
jgi:uncharacterized membrane protein YgcG